jgi:2-polyprenyl-3-methyl-5-hydroxy-6-metoxy-1,4-benzoquinol methylase
MKSADYHNVPRTEMLAYVPRTARTILDVGCGTGAFGGQLKTRPAEVWGIELDEQAAQIARTRLDRVLQGDVESVWSTLPVGRFDCIVFNDVLEHLVNPEKVLTSAKRLLSADGTIVCSLPNVRHWRNLWNLMVHKQWRYEDSGTLDRTHLRFYTERSIVEMFQRVGFEILQMDGINGFSSWKFEVIKVASFGLLSDVFDFQFACLVRPRTT